MTIKKYIPELCIDVEFEVEVEYNREQRQTLECEPIAAYYEIVAVTWNRTLYSEVENGIIDAYTDQIDFTTK